MTPDERKMIMDLFYDLQHRMEAIELQLFNKLKVARVIDISDDKVHIAKQIVNSWETKDGVILHIK